MTMNASTRRIALINRLFARRVRWLEREFDVDIDKFDYASDTFGRIWDEIARDVDAIKCQRVRLRDGARLEGMLNGS